MTALPSLASAIYTGSVLHRRVKPRAHSFRYSAYWLLFDIDELPALHRRLRFFSHNRWNIFSFHDADHGTGSDTPLRAQIDRHLRTAGIELDGGPVRILCMPRILGFVFNPLSVHFCYGRDGALKALLYEVHNTFRQRHSYLIGVPHRSGATVEQTCAKRFYVSPFMEMAMTYRFKVRPPAEAVSVLICGDDAGGPVIAATLEGQRRELTDAALLRVFFAMPLMTAKVVAAIHWEAVRLWLKGLSIIPRPAPPQDPVTAACTKEISVAE
jgi:DUF1365 family protein